MPVPIWGLAGESYGSTSNRMLAVDHPFPSLDIPDRARSSATAVPIPLLAPATMATLSRVPLIHCSSSDRQFQQSSRPQDNRSIDHAPVQVQDGRPPGIDPGCHQVSGVPQFRFIRREDAVDHLDLGGMDA